MNRRFVFGFVAGGVAATVLAVLVANLSHWNSPQDQGAIDSPTPSRSETEQNDAKEGRWIVKARELTMPSNREYALPLNNPDVVPAANAGHMKPDDLVVGVTIYQHARAYPWWILSNYHIVNDTFDKGKGSPLPVLVSLCEQCSGSAAFVPTLAELPDRPLTFQISGVDSGTFEIADFQTHSRWHPFSGRALAGPLEGTQLPQIASVIERWDNWKERHPNTDVVVGSSTLRARPHGLSHGAQIGHSFVHKVFWATSNQTDDRLPRNELVYGLLGDGEREALAVRLEDIRSESYLQFEDKGNPILLVVDGQYGARSFSRMLDGELLHFELVSQSPLLLRDHSGKFWNSDGELQTEDTSTGTTRRHLRPLRGYLTEWYEWVSSQTGTRIYARP